MGFLEEGLAYSWRDWLIDWLIDWVFLAVLFCGVCSVWDLLKVWSGVESGLYCLIRWVSSQCRVFFLLKFDCVERAYGGLCDWIIVRSTISSISGGKGLSGEVIDPGWLPCEFFVFWCGWWFRLQFVFVGVIVFLSWVSEVVWLGFCIRFFYIINGIRDSFGSSNRSRKDSFTSELCCKFLRCFCFSVSL